ncbi:putative RNA-directed RNA polymerase (Sad-1) [Penicillium brasilianum]|uniref:RNA-dependent RNA polymerase n=1 Tax=Penicillium brasilianum TaxID=104259 RepID=A0A1S9R851_PENBI|nr:putative RNA-directed RNA polymerase (Sad-1) [Penicillium brasilianum]
MSAPSESTSLPSISVPPVHWLPWKQWETVGVNISRVPQEANAQVLWQAFSKEGSICSIDVFDDRHGNRAPKGRIRFKPPPANSFWRSGIYNIRLPSGRIASLVVALDFSLPSHLLRGPSGEDAPYPRECQELPCKRFDVGVLLDEFTTCAMRTFQKEASPKVVVDVRSKVLHAYFSVTVHEARPFIPSVPEVSPSTFRLKIPFLQLTRVWETHEPDSDEVSLIIILDSPPIYHRQSTDILSTSSTHTSWRDTDLWQRQTCIAHKTGVQDLVKTNLRRSGQIVDLGRWNVFKFTFSTRNYLEQDYKLFIEILKDHNIFIRNEKHFRTITERPEPVWRWIDVVESRTRFRSTLEEMAHTDYIYLPFNVRYQLEVCISHGHLSEFTMSRGFVKDLEELGVAPAVRLLEHVATNKEQYLDPMEIFKIRYPKGISDSMIPNYCCFMRTARITPTTVHYNTPTIDTSNRVTRNYQEYLDRFLRIRFTDEKTQGRIYSNAFKSNDEVFARIKRTLKNGIIIGDRHYEFLAFGNSQFREHGAYFFAPTANLTAAHIRAWMGQFSHIRNVARYAARLGQCFSTTRALAGCVVTVKQIPDISRNGYCFSDGIGKISKFTTRVLSAEMGIFDPYGEPPSAYQFRLGGCKGMLTVSSDPIAYDLHIRPSQIKFEAEHKRLEIIRWSQFSAATLNRQLILVLSALGIRGQVFLDRLNTMLESIRYAMGSDRQAIELLEKFIDPNRKTLALAEMVSAGFRRTNEPFVSSMLALWKSWHQKYLKDKAKILVEKGASLLGVLDETGTLKGHFDRQVPHKNMAMDKRIAALPEIFVQISSVEKGVRPRVIQGVCIVARNPSLHIGDIRVVHAVDCEALRHLVDVIVFPQTGDRDVMSMCSGGDLDGDDYLVIWDQDLIPDDWYVKPLNYLSRRAPDLDRDVTINDITSFYVTYMKNDSLPRIAHAHMAHGDKLQDGVSEPKCIRLAQLHSDAVDYNKTGIPAVMERSLQPHTWPHFMDKKHKRTYHSRKILGKLYDAVKTEDFSPKLSNPFDSRILECSLKEESQRFEHFASELKVNYDTSMRRIMAQYGIQTEFEVWSTFVLEHNSMCRDYKLHEELGKVANGLQSSIQDQCYKHLEGKRDFGYVAPLAVAMYRITHQEVQDALASLQDESAYDDQDELETSRLPLISFPWVFYKVLSKIVITPVDELQNSLAEAQAFDAKKGLSKSFTHAEVMEMVGRDGKTGLIPKHETDVTGTRLPTEIGADLGGRKPGHFGDHDLYERDLYQETPGGSSSVHKDEQKQNDDMDPDFVATNDDKASSLDKSSVLHNRSMNDVKEDAKTAIKEATDEDDDEHDGDLHIVEKEGDVKPGAIDELIALTGKDYDADDGDDW